MKLKEFDIPKNVELLVDEKNQQYYFDEDGNKVTLLKDGKMVAKKIKQP